MTDAELEVHTHRGAKGVQRGTFAEDYPGSAFGNLSSSADAPGSSCASFIDVAGWFLDLQRLVGNGTA